MLLKVSDGDDGWVLFDNVNNVHLTSKTHQVSHATELTEIGGEGAIILVPKNCFRNGSKVCVGVIEFESRDAHRKALFTNIVYVCDDRGNTIDRMNVRNVRGN